LVRRSLGTSAGSLPVIIVALIPLALAGVRIEDERQALCAYLSLWCGRDHCPFIALID